MSELSDYHERLARLITDEEARLGLSRRQLSQRIGLGPAALYKWVNRKLKGEIDQGTVKLLADYFGKSRESLQNYLNFGEWLPEVLPDTEKIEKLADRVATLEATVHRLSQRPTTAELSGRYLANTDDLRSMTVLGLALQQAIAATGHDWRCPSTVKMIYAHCLKDPKQGGLGTTPAIAPGRFQRFIWGLELPKGRAEISELQLAIWAFTREEQWSHKYMSALVAQGYAVSLPAATRPSATVPHPTAQR